MQVAQDSHVEARVTDLPAPRSLSRPAQCLRQPPALLCRLGSVLPVVGPGSPGVTPPKRCLLLNECCLFWMIEKAILQICCLFVTHFIKFFASFKMLSIMTKLPVEICFFGCRGFFHSRWSSCLGSVSAPYRPLLLPWRGEVMRLRGQRARSCGSPCLWPPWGQTMSPWLLAQDRGLPGGGGHSRCLWGQDTTRAWASAPALQGGCGCALARATPTGPPEGAEDAAPPS